MPPIAHVPTFSISYSPCGWGLGDPYCAPSNVPSFIQIQGEEVERLSLRAWDEHILIVRVLRAREPLSPLPASPPCPHPPPTDKRKSYRPATPGDAPIPCPVGFP